MRTPNTHPRLNLKPWLELIFLLLIIFAFVLCSGCSTPPQTKDTIKIEQSSWYNPEEETSPTQCTQVQNVFIPETEADVIAIVKNAVAQNQHIKAIGSARSTSSILCTDGVAISTEYLNQPIRVETFEGEDTVLVEAGTQLGDLSEWLLDHGKSLGFAMTGYRDLSVGGAIATASHGSSFTHNSVISNSVQSITLVDANGILREFSKGTSPENIWKVLTTHLGLMGVVTQVRLKVFPAVNLDTAVHFYSDVTLQSDPFSSVKNCDYGLIHWFPSAKKIMTLCGNVTNKKPDAGANNNLLNSPLAPLQPNTLRAVGPSNRMVSSSLTSRKGFQIKWEAALPLSLATKAIQDLSKAVKKNSSGIFLRFSPESIFVEIPDEGLIKMLIQKYHAHAHWGKNSDAIFNFSRELGLYNDEIKTLQSAVTELDPYGVFSNHFTQNLGIQYLKH